MRLIIAGSLVFAVALATSGIDAQRSSDGQAIFRSTRLATSSCGPTGCVDRHLKLNLRPDQKKDLVEFLKSL